MLAVELLDELVYGLRESAWPLIRRDLDLTYAEVGLLLGVPGIVGVAVEPLLGVLGDGPRRRRLVLGGGVAFVAGTLAIALSPGFGVLLVSLAVLFPASGAFVSLSQATLMDVDPPARERNMARWTLVGSVGMVAAPLLLAALLQVGGGWRVGFAALSALVLAALARLGTLAFPSPGATGGLVEGLREAARILRRGAVLRWLLLLELADLMLDVLHGFLALYLVDVAGLAPERAPLAIAVWTGAGLVGDALLLLVLRHVDGLTFLRGSAAAAAVAYPAFLLVSPIPAKVALLALLGLLNSGWYAIPKARLYAELPDRSGTAVALGTVTGLLGGLFPLGIGLLAGAVGLGTALWVSLAAPLALLLLVPSGRP